MLACPHFKPCPMHAKEAWDHKGKTAHQRGYGAAWQALRLKTLERDHWLCQEHRRRGEVIPATTVDHIRNKARGGTDDPANLEALCRACQQRKAGREGQAAK